MGTFFWSALISAEVLCFIGFCPKPYYKMYKHVQKQSCKSNLFSSIPYICVCTIYHYTIYRKKHVDLLKTKRPYCSICKTQNTEVFCSSWFYLDYWSNEEGGKIIFIVLMWNILRRILYLIVYYIYVLEFEDIM